MQSFLTVKEAALRWGCSERRVQISCKEGRIPGVQKVNGIRLLPADAGDSKETKETFCMHPEIFYGRDTAVHVLKLPGGTEESFGKNHTKTP